MLKGIHYQNETVYGLLTFLKLGSEHRRRFELAAARVPPGSDVLDVCAGPGTLRDFLPADCRYRCVEPSAGFGRVLRGKGLEPLELDLHQGLPAPEPRAGVAAMLISLSHFRGPALDRLLEDLKEAAARVVIVEDVLERRRPESSWRQRVMNYLCGADFDLFTAPEFEAVVKRHGYSCDRPTPRYMVAEYPPR